MITSRYRDTEAINDLEDNDYTSKCLHDKSCEEYPASKWGYCLLAVSLLEQTKQDINSLLKTSYGFYIAIGQNTILYKKKTVLKSVTVKPQYFPLQELGQSVKGFCLTLLSIRS